jgi:hypothetical protein
MADRERSSACFFRNDPALFASRRSTWQALASSDAKMVPFPIAGGSGRIRRIPGPWQENECVSGAGVKCPTGSLALLGPWSSIAGILLAAIWQGCVWTALFSGVQIFEE